MHIYIEVGYISGEQMEPEYKVMINGELVEWKDATIHVTTHALHYGSGVFEGIRGYWDGSAIQIFRLEDHVERILKNASILRLDTSFDLLREIVELLRVNNFHEDAYIRPLIYFGPGGVGINPAGHPTHHLVFAIPFGRYLDVEKGISVCISPWKRITDTCIPPRGKISGGYINSVLAKQDAVKNGYDEAILLNQQGYVCEGTGENLFIIRDGRLITPPVYADILEGITRASIIEMAQEDGYEVLERNVYPTELYIADEVFLCGTAAEITPVVSVDHHLIGDGGTGRITKQLADHLSSIARGKDTRYKRWLTSVG